LSNNGIEENKWSQNIICVAATED